MREAVCWLRNAEMNFLWHRLLQACVVLVTLKGEWQLFYVLSGTTGGVFDWTAVWVLTCVMHGTAFQHSVKALNVSGHRSDHIRFQDDEHKWINYRCKSRKDNRTRTGQPYLPLWLGIASWISHILKPSKASRSSSLQLWHCRIIIPDESCHFCASRVDGDNPKVSAHTRLKEFGLPRLCWSVCLFRATDYSLPKIWTKLCRVDCFKKLTLSTL